MDCSLIDKIASNEVMEASYAWLCKSRADYSPQNDVWWLREDWQNAKNQIQQQLVSGDFQFSPLQIVYIEGQRLNIWCAKDSLVLKCLAIVLNEELNTKIPPSCYHVKWHGGLKQAVLNVYEQLYNYEFILKSDIASYYASINQENLLEELSSLLPNQPLTLNLIANGLKRVETFGGHYYDRDQGIAKGSPLSPLLGAVALLPLDRQCDKPHTFYVRYMDDWLILAKTRHYLRDAIKNMWTVLNRLKLNLATEKTYIGRISKGFDFLGYHLSPGVLEISKRTRHNHLMKLNKLYEHGATQEELVQYKERFDRWCKI